MSKSLRKESEQLTNLESIFFKNVTGNKLSKIEKQKLTCTWYDLLLSYRKGGCK